MEFGFSENMWQLRTGIAGLCFLLRSLKWILTIVNFLLQFTDGCVFLAACAATDRDEVDRLIRRGADIDTTNVDGLTALHQVSKSPPSIKNMPATDKKIDPIIVERCWKEGRCKSRNTFLWSCLLPRFILLLTSFVRPESVTWKM